MSKVVDPDEAGEMKLTLADPSTMLADPAEAGEIKSTVTDLAEAGEIKLTLADPTDRMLVLQLQTAKFRRWWIQLMQAN